MTRVGETVRVDERSQKNGSQTGDRIARTHGCGGGRGTCVLCAFACEGEEGKRMGTGRDACGRRPRTLGGHGVGQCSAVAVDKQARMGTANGMQYDVIRDEKEKKKIDTVRHSVMFGNSR